MIRTGFAIFSIFFFLWSCQPGFIYTQKATEATDSVLFYQAAAPDDPFLDSLSVSQHIRVQLDTILTPPPKPPAPDTLRTADGFRIQIFAGTDSVNAAAQALRASRVVQDSVYVFHQNGLFKTQIGDYLYRSSADSTRHLLFKNGLTGAWIVPRTIYLYKTLPDSNAPAQQRVTHPAPAPTSYKYTIQVLAVSDEGRAQSRVKQLIEQFPYPAFYKKSGTVFKLYVGKFQTREAADRALKEIRANEYPDAWLVY